LQASIIFVCIPKRRSYKKREAINEESRRGDTESAPEMGCGQVRQLVGCFTFWFLYCIFNAEM